MKRFSASCLPIAAGAIAPLASPGSAGVLLPSLARCPSSGEPARSLAKLSVRSSILIRSNCFEIESSAAFRRVVFSMATIR